ncbi:MAG: glycoside hydrolase family 6 protein [Polyangiales bacterium]
MPGAPRGAAGASALGASNGSAPGASSNGSAPGAGQGQAPAANGGNTSSPANGAPQAASPRVDNPYADGVGYVNPEWRAKAMGEPGGERIANTSTAVWLDRIAAIEGTENSMSNGPMGVRDHLNAALEQGAAYIQFVIYDLPGRDCAALASNGELGTTDLPRYQAEYIDPIAAIMADPAYAGLRIINIVEIDSLPNLITNLSAAKCTEMKANGGYVQGIAYALQKLGALPNVYNYLDAGHHGWLGWETNFGPSAELLVETAKLAGLATVQGFITNTANYSVMEEPFLRNGPAGLQETKFVNNNPYLDEPTFALALRDKLISLGFDQNLGMLIDTSRNGWGGPARPTAASTATDPATFVDQSRIDRRANVGNWCNQAGAGLGERPRAAPQAGIDAYVWIKPPGESDGASMEIPNNDGKGFDRMCDPTYGGNERNANSPTSALPNAPLSGAWFSGQFQELMQNAYPPL